MKKKYTKNHPLWLVWDFQNEILKRGGKINRHSDLLSYFEGNSLEPDIKPMIAFKYLISSNVFFIKETTGLFELKQILYKKFLDGKDGCTYYTIVERSNFVDNVNKTYKEKLNDKTDRISTILPDNEFIIKINNDYVVVLNEKYIDILRLIRNGYKSKMSVMEKNKILPALIIAIGLIIAALIYAYTNRYEISGGARIDKWKGVIEKMELKR